LPTGASFAPGWAGRRDGNGPAIEWSADKNIVWKLALPGPGTSSPVTVGNRIFLTCYSGYALDTKEPGKMDDLRRHLLCVDRKTGKTAWTKVFDPVLPEHKYAGEGAYHGYAASTAASDGERLYVFFGQIGSLLLRPRRQTTLALSRRQGTNGWGSGSSPLLYKNLVIINASVESNSMIALDKLSGKEVWKTPKINSAWNTPMLVTTAEKETELVISVQDRIVSMDPDTGKELWTAEGVHRYVCPNVVAQMDRWTPSAVHSSLPVIGVHRHDAIPAR